MKGLDDAHAHGLGVLKLINLWMLRVVDFPRDCQTATTLTLVNFMSLTGGLVEFFAFSDTRRGRWSHGSVDDFLLTMKCEVGVRVVVHRLRSCSPPSTAMASACSIAVDIAIVFVIVIRIGRYRLRFNANDGRQHGKAENC